MASRNFSSVALATTLSAGINASVTAIAVTAAVGLPAAPFLLTLDTDTANEEIVLVTAVAGLNLTVTRGYDSSVAVSHSTGAAVRHSAAAIDFREANAHVNASAGVHGLAGTVVGTTDAQTLSSKTLTAPVIGDLTSAQHGHTSAATGGALAIAALGLVATPIGAIFPYAGSVAPTYFVKCDGSAINRTTYATLFALVGVAYGVGDGTTTFNVPNLVSKFLRGGTPGVTGGADAPTLAIANLPSHDHGGTVGATSPTDHAHANTISDGAGAHQHTATYKTVTYGTGSTDSYVRTDGSTASTIGGFVGQSAGGHNHSINNVGVSGGAGVLGHAHSVSAQGSGTALENRPAYVEMTYIIRAL